MNKLLDRISDWYFSKYALPYWCVLLVDCSIVIFAGLISAILDEGLMYLSENLAGLMYGLCICLVFYVISFRLFHTYKNIIRYSSFYDLRQVTSATLYGTATTAVVSFFGRDYLLPTIILPDLLVCLQMLIITTMLMWGVRVAVKGLHDIFRRDNTTRNVFIYGVRDGGISLAKSIQQQEPQQYSLVGFVSPDGDLESKFLMGVKVRKDGPNLVQHMLAAHAHVLIVSPLQADHFSEQQELINSLIANKIKMLVMPQPEAWDGKSDLHHEQLHEVEIEDLLPREKIDVDMDAIGQMLRGKRILITGAAGSIGSEMARQVTKFQPAELILVDQAETPMHDMRLWMNNFFQKGSSSSNGSMNGGNGSSGSNGSMNGGNGSSGSNGGSNGLNSEALNQASAIEPLEPKVFTIVTSIADKKHMEKIFSEHRPEYVFHAAAYKHVPMMEDNPGQAVRNNIYGTRVIADLAVKYGTKKFVMISTDKAVNPTNVMGCSKRICEIYCQSLNAAIQQVQNSSSGSNGSKEGSSGSSGSTANACSNGSNELNSEALNSEALNSLNQLDSLNQLNSPSGIELFEPSKLRQYDGSLPCTQFVTTRFGNVLGSNGSVIPIFKKQIAKGGPITVTHPDIIRYFMLIPEACKLVLEAGTMGNGGEIFVFDMGKPVRIVDLAKRMISLSGAHNIEIKFSGLRDGEKLSEELLSTKENTKPTHHPKIMVAQVREYDYETAVANEEELMRLSDTFDDMAIVKKMKEIVPEYKSQVSKYQVLDK